MENSQPLIYAHIGCILDSHPSTPHLNCIPISEPEEPKQNMHGPHSSSLSITPFIILE